MKLYFVLLIVSSSEFVSVVGQWITKVMLWS